MDKNNYGIEILQARYYAIKEKEMASSEEMMATPNQWSDANVIRYRKMMKDIEQCLIILGIVS